MFVLSLGLMTGCGAIAEVTEDIPDVSVNEDGGSVTLNDGDGESVTIDTSNDGEIPEWFPSELPLPEDYAVLTASAAEVGNESLKQLAITTPEDFDTVVDTLDEGFAAEGVEPETREVGNASDMRTAIFGVEVAGEEWIITASNLGGEEEELTISYGTLDEGE